MIERLYEARDAEGDALRLNLDDSADTFDFHIGGEAVFLSREDTTRLRDTLSTHLGKPDPVETPDVVDWKEITLALLLDRYVSEAKTR